MEQRGLLLRGIARVLNAGGCALLSVYDAAASIRTGVLPGEKGNLKAQLREYEKKMDRLYYEIGKEVTLVESKPQMSAAGEAGIKLVASYRVEIEKIKQRLKQIEEEEKAAREAAIESARARAKPAADAGEPAAAGAPAASEASTGAKTEEAKEVVAEAAETPEPELPKGTAATEVPGASETSPGAATEEKTSSEALEKMLKSDLLKLCIEKGIEADKKMTKPEIIELILKRS
jgi:hypothetical protein